MIKIGHYNTLHFKRSTAQGMYLSDGTDEVLLPRKQVPESVIISDQITVFVYLDSCDRPIATTTKPFGTVGDYVYLRAVDITKIGAFLDWGLEKDLFVPFKQMVVPMQKGKKYVVRICFDDLSKRLLGIAKIIPFLRSQKCNLRLGEKVSFLVYQAKPGKRLIVVNNSLSGIIADNDLQSDLDIGRRGVGYVQNISPNKLIITPNPYRENEYEDLQQLIIKELECSQGFLPYHDKSDPKDIKQIFGTSKKSFKKAIGMLYRSKRITITDQGIKLNK